MRGGLRSEERRVGEEWRSLCDWSSDVCSSDLTTSSSTRTGIHSARVATTGQVQNTTGGSHLPRLDSLAVDELRMNCKGAAWRFARGRPILASSVDARRLKIGRASGRGRVEISV